MKRKKLFSMAVAGMLVAAQMVMPVAAEGGNYDVTVTTKSAVLRVTVPSSIAIAVNQFEKGDTGSQIFSDAFTMTNKSEVAVQVKVTSTATLASADTITLTDTRSAAAGDSTTTTGKAWLAMAAKSGSTTAGEEYDDLTTGTTSTPVVETIGTLTEANKNVKTFVQGSGADATTATAEQTFYLKAPDATTIKYAKIDVSTADKLANEKALPYRQVLKLSANITSVNSVSTLQAQVDAKDIYAIGTKNSADDDIHYYAKGTVITALPATANYTYTYHSVAGTGLPDAADSTNTYIFGEAANTAGGGEAAFRYIGALSTGKTAWSAGDLSKINIAYDIIGITGTSYNNVKDNCKGGLYIGGVAASSATACLLQTITNGNGSTITSAITATTGIYIKVGSNFLTAAKEKLTSVKLNGTALTITVSGNSATNNSGLYFKLPTGTTVRANDVFTIEVDGTTYTFTVAS